MSQVGAIFDQADCDGHGERRPAGCFTTLGAPRTWLTLGGWTWELAYHVHTLSDGPQNVRVASKVALATCKSTLALDVNTDFDFKSSLCFDPREGRPAVAPQAWGRPVHCSHWVAAVEDGILADRMRYRGPQNVRVASKVALATCKPTLARYVGTAYYSSRKSANRTVDR